MKLLPLKLFLLLIVTLATSGSVIFRNYRNMFLFWRFFLGPSHRVWLVIVFRKNSDETTINQSILKKGVKKLHDLQSNDLHPLDEKSYCPLQAWKVWENEHPVYYFLLFFRLHLFPAATHSSSVETTKPLRNFPSRFSQAFLLPGTFSCPN